MNKIKLYPNQEKAKEAIANSDKGIICMPTATGKTFSQADAIADDITKNNGMFNMYVVNAPRILLTYQLLKEVYAYLSNSNVEARFMFVHSGGTTNESELEEIRLQANQDGAEIPFAEIPSGTSVNDIRDMMLRAKELNVPLIMFSTYNSAIRIEEARVMLGKQPLRMVMNDEAHYLVQEQFHDILDTLTMCRCYFFTATMLHTPSDQGRGMNNENDYGPLLYEMKPIEAIEEGRMVRPKFHFVITDGVYTPEDFDASLNYVIQSSFEQHEEVLKVNMGAKVLVTVRGTQDIRNFLDSPEYQIMRQNDVNIYSVASNPEIGCKINGEEVRRQDFLSRIKEDGKIRTNKMLVLHYDILAEGIDSSGFSAIMPLRWLNRSKLLQTLGRASRLDPIDRENIAMGVIKPSELDRMVKPYAYIIIPDVITSNADSRDHIVNLVREMRTYGFRTSDMLTNESMGRGLPEVEDPDTLNEQERTIRETGNLITELGYILEQDDDASLTKFEFFNKKIESL